MKQPLVHPGLNLGSTDEYSHEEAEPVIFGVGHDGWGGAIAFHVFNNPGLTAFQY